MNESIKRSDPSDLAPERLIEGSSGCDDLGEHGGAREGPTELSAGAHIGDAVKRLGPPLVALDTEPGHGDGVVDHEPDFLRQCESGYEVLNPDMDGDVSVAELEPPCESVPRVACKGRPPLGWACEGQCNAEHQRNG